MCNINHTYARIGALWEGRYKASLVQTEQYLLTCYRYIELNPVRANMVAAPGDYLWTSYQANAYGQNDKNITAHSEYLRLGQTQIERCKTYRELFKDKIEETLQRSTRRKQAGRPCVKGMRRQYDIY